MPSLRLVSVSAAGFDDRRALARAIERHAPDVACVSGAPSLARWRSKCAALAREANLVVVAGGRSGGGWLLLSNLGVDVEGTEDVLLGSAFVPRPAGGVVAAMRRLGSPFTVAAGVDATSARVVPDQRPVITVRGTGARDVTCASPIEITGTDEFAGGVRLDLALA